VSGAIRPLERDDLEAVASLYEVVARSGSRVPAPRLAAHFDETLFDHPWVDAEIPSLVYEEPDGRIVGFLASHVRRMRLDGRSVRAGCSGHVVTEPDVRSRAVGLLLMRHYMAGPQELTFTDTASDPVRRMWESLGGEKSQLNCVGWVRVFRPAAFAADIAARRREPGSIARVARPLQRAVDAASVGLARGALRPLRPRASAAELTPGAIAEHLEHVTRGFRLRPEYEDEEFVAWLLDAVAAVRMRGALVARLVRASDERVLGWYVYFLAPGGTAQVLQVAVAERDGEQLLDHLLDDAYRRGACAVQGRVQGHLLRALTERRCLLHRAGYLALVHARDAELLHAIQSGRALLTRLEGEWWMGHHLEPFGGNWKGAP
jgi:hypothetical protein